MATMLLEWGAGKDETNARRLVTFYYSVLVAEVDDRIWME